MLGFSNILYYLYSIIIQRYNNTNTKRNTNYWLTMKLKNEIINKMRERRDLQKLILKIMGITRDSYYRWLRENTANGPLTTLACAKIIAENLNVEPEDLYTNEVNINNNNKHNERVINK